MPINTIPVRDRGKSYLDYYRNNTPQNTTYDLSGYGLPSPEALQAIVDSMPSEPAPIQPQAIDAYPPMQRVMPLSAELVRNVLAQIPQGDPILQQSVQPPSQSVMPISSVMAQPITQSTSQPPLPLPPSAQPVTIPMGQPVGQPTAQSSAGVATNNTQQVVPTAQQQVGTGLTDPLEYGNQQIRNSIEALSALDYPQFSPQSYSSPYTSQIDQLRQSMPQMDKRTSGLLYALNLLNGIGGIVAPSTAGVFAEQAHPYAQAIATNTANVQKSQQLQSDAINDLIAKDAQERQDFLLNEQKRKDTYSGDSTRFAIDKANKIAGLSDKVIDNSTADRRTDVAEQKMKIMQEKYTSAVELGESIIRANPNMSEADKAAVRGLSANDKLQQMIPMFAYGGSVTQYAESIKKLDDLKQKVESGKLSIQDAQLKNYDSLIQFRKLMGDQGWSRLNVSYGNFLSRIEDSGNDSNKENQQRNEKISSAKSDYNSAVNQKHAYLQKQQAAGIIKIVDANKGEWKWVDGKYDATIDSAIRTQDSAISEARQAVTNAESIPIAQGSTINGGDFAPRPSGGGGSSNANSGMEFANSGGQASPNPLRLNSHSGDVHPEVKSAFEKSKEEWVRLYPDRPVPTIHDGFRTEGQQQQRRNQTSRAAQGRSRHQDGLAVDVKFGGLVESQSVSKGYFKDFADIMNKNGIDWGGSSDPVHYSARRNQGGASSQPTPTEVENKPSPSQAQANSPKDATKQAAAADFNTKLAAIRSSSDKASAKSLRDILDRIGRTIFNDETIGNYRAELNKIIDGK